MTEPCCLSATTRDKLDELLRQSEVLAGVSMSFMYRTSRQTHRKTACMTCVHPVTPSRVSDRMEFASAASMEGDQFPVKEFVSR